MKSKNFNAAKGVSKFILSLGKLTRAGVAHNLDGQIEGEIPDPTWPSLSLDEILNIAFGSSHIIETLDHPALLKLWGAD